jgi:branched-chain amino acid transport system ATP-binding protein
MEMQTKNNAIKPILEFKDVSIWFGGVQALSNVSFEILEHEILSIIGPNGAGKTCILNCISGYYRPQKGLIRYNGEDLTHMPRHEIAGMGIARTFQNAEVFKDLTVLENIMLGRHKFIKSNVWAQALYFGWHREKEIEHRCVAEEIIDFLELNSYRYKIVGTLPYGVQKRVQLGQALITEPDLLLLDEPMAGMNLEEKEDIARFILDIYEDREITIVLIEHDMGVVMDIANRVIVLDFGIKIAQGSPDDIKSDERVIKCYLGMES